MTDRIIKVLEDGGLIARGLSKRTDGSLMLRLIDDQDVLPVTINWEPWLGTDTITAVENEATTVTVSNASNTTTEATFSLSGASGYVRHEITTTAGSVKSLVISINGTDHSYSDYPSCR